MVLPYISMCPLHPELLSRLPPQPIPQAVTEHPLRVPCIIHQTPTGCFTHGNVSVLFSQIIPSSPFPLSPKSVLYVCVAFAALHIGSSEQSF